LCCSSCSSRSLFPTFPTDTPTDDPTEDDDDPDEELLYDAKGGLMKPGTSVKARAALAGSSTAASTPALVSTDSSAAASTPALVSTDSSDADGAITQEEKGSTRTRTRRSTPTRAKGASTRSSRSRSKPKKKRSKKDRRRRRKRESSSSSSDNDRRRGRGRSPSSTSRSSTSSSGDSNWEEFYDHETVVKVRELLKAPPPKPHATFPRAVFPLKRQGRSSTCVRPTRGRRISG
jgi:hypothetical protein